MRLRGKRSRIEYNLGQLGHLIYLLIYSRISQPRRNIPAQVKNDIEERAPLTKDSHGPAGFAQYNVEMIVQPFSSQSRTAPLRRNAEIKDLMLFIII
jgi:hypothetical protein